MLPPQDQAAIEYSILSVDGRADRAAESDPGVVPARIGQLSPIELKSLASVRGVRLQQLYSCEYRSDSINGS
jgi:hypothetical protein